MRSMCLNDFEKELKSAVQQRAIEMMRGLDHLSDQEIPWEQGCSVWRKLTEDPMNASKYHQGGCQEDGVRFFLVVPSDRKRSSTST